jgi:hypothetical protein
MYIANSWIGGSAPMIMGAGVVPSFVAPLLVGTRFRVNDKPDM